LSPIIFTAGVFRCLKTSGNHSRIVVYWLWRLNRWNPSRRLASKRSWANNGWRFYGGKKCKKFTRMRNM